MTPPAAGERTLWRNEPQFGTPNRISCDRTRGNSLTVVFGPLPQTTRICTFGPSGPSSHGCQSHSRRRLDRQVLHHRLGVSHSRPVQRRPATVGFCVHVGALTDQVLRHRQGVPPEREGQGRLAIAGQAIESPGTRRPTGWWWTTGACPRSSRTRSRFSRPRMCKGRSHRT